MCLSSLRCFFAFAITATLIALATLSIPTVASIPKLGGDETSVGLCPMFYPGATC
jgi:hypothetical protein